MLTECEHEFHLVEYVSGTRLRCKHCAAIELFPNYGESDGELEAILDNEDTPDEQWMAAAALLLRRKYERETGLPFFEESLDYTEWLENQRLDINNGK